MREDDDDANAPESPGKSEHSPAGELVRLRRPYRAPTIRYLGCVRDLTLGGASGFAEGAGTFFRRRM
jgi:hypothetical protein